MSVGSRPLARVGLALVVVPVLGLAAPDTCFEPARRLSPAGLQADVSFNFKKSIATLPDGSVHATFHAEDGTRRAVFYQRSPDAGAHWESPVPLAILADTGSQPGHPAIAASDGWVYVAWHEASPDGSSEVYLRRSPDGGASFEPAFRVSHGGGGTHASLAADRSHLHVAWGDLRSGTPEIYVRSSSNHGDELGPEQILSDEPYASWVPSVGSDGETAVVAWVDYRDANEEEYLRVSRDGGASWEPRVRVTRDPADSWAPSVVVRDSTIFMAWFDRRPAGLLDGDVEAPLDAALALLGLHPDPAPPRDPEVYYLPIFQERIASKRERILDVAPDWVAGGGDLLALEELLVEFQRRLEVWSFGWGIFFSRSPDLGASWEPARLVSTPGGPAERPSLGVAASDVHVAWYDRRHGDAEIYYRHSPDAGIRFGPERRLSRAAGDSLRPSLAAEPGRVFLLWMDERDGDRAIFTTRGFVRGGTSR